MRFSHMASAALAIAGQVAATPRPMDLDVLAPRLNEEQEVKSLIRRGIEEAKRSSSKSTTFSLEHTWAADETLVKGSITQTIGDSKESVNINLSCRECYTHGKAVATISDHAIIKPRLKVEFDDFEAYMDLNVNISSSATYTKTLFRSETPVGISTDLFSLGIVFYVDLIFSLTAEVDFSAGFYVTMDDGAYLEADIFGDDISSHDLKGLSAKNLPVTVTAGKATFKADLRLRLEAGAEADLDFIGVGAEVGLYVNILEFIAQLSTTDTCALQAMEEFDINAGVYAKLDVVADYSTFGAVPTKSTTLYTFASMTQCVIDKTTSAAATKTSSHALTAISTPVKEISQTTNKASSKSTSEGTSKTAKVTSSTDAYSTTKSSSHAISKTVSLVTTKSTGAASYSMRNSTSTISGSVGTTSGTGSPYTSSKATISGTGSHATSQATISGSGSHSTSSSLYYSMHNYTRTLSGTVGTASGTGSQQTPETTVSGTGYYTSKTNAQTASKSSSEAPYYPTSGYSSKGYFASSVATFKTASGSAPIQSGSSKTKTGITASTPSGTVSSPLSLVTVSTKSSSPYGQYSNSSSAVTTTGTIGTGNGGEGYVTSTLYRTTKHTIVQCAMTVVNCPTEYASEVVVTETVDVYTTVCPVMATATPPASWYTTTAAASTDAAATTTGLANARPAVSYAAHRVTDLVTLTAVPTPIVNTFCPNPTSSSTLATGPGSSSSVFATATAAATSTHVYAAPSGTGHFYPQGNHTASHHPSGSHHHASGTGETHHPSGTGRAYYPGGTDAAYPAENTHVEAVYETSATAAATHASASATGPSPVATAGAGKVAVTMSGLVGAVVALLAFL